jgi:hypothetical protein
MQTLRLDVEKRSDETQNSLGALSGAILSMMAPAIQAPESNLHCGHAAANGELRKRIDELHGSSERSLTCSQQISAAAAKLCAGAQLASDSFTVATQVDQTFGRCCDVLQRIAAGSGVHPAGAAGGLQHLAARYTMQSEREVHEMAAAQVKPQDFPAEQDRLAVPVPTGDFSDNVELF